MLLVHYVIAEYIGCIGGVSDISENQLKVWVLIGH